MSAGHERESLSHVDAAWLRMDSPVNAMVITSALLFEGAVPFAAIEALIAERLLPHLRFRQRVVDLGLPLLAPCWELDPAFDLRAHLHHVRVPAPADKAAFADLLSDLMSLRLDHDHPLWQAYIVDDAPGGTALVVRLHHCIGDGVALVRLLLSLCDGSHPVLPHEVGLRPPPKTHGAVELAKRAASQAATLGRLLLLPADAATPLKGPLGTRKLVAWSEPMPLEGVKAAAQRFGATVNDVLSAALTGALREYLVRRDCMHDGLQVRSMVPVFLRDEETEGLGNHFGLVFLDYPVGLADGAARVREIKRSMDALKCADDATVAFGVLDAIGIASAELEHIALEIFTRKATLLTTNVPGPPEPVTLAGSKVHELLVWAPVSGYIGLGVTLISYAGHVRMGVNADARLVESPSEIVEAFERDLTRLIAQ